MPFPLDCAHVKQIAHKITINKGNISHSLFVVNLAPFRPTDKVAMADMLHGTHGYIRSMDKILRPWMKYLSMEKGTSL